MGDVMAQCSVVLTLGWVSGQVLNKKYSAGQKIV